MCAFRVAHSFGVRGHSQLWGWGLLTALGSLSFGVWGHSFGVGALMVLGSLAALGSGTAHSFGVTDSFGV